MSALGIKTRPPVSTARACAALDCTRTFMQPGQGKPSPYCPMCRWRRRQARQAAHYLRQKGRSGAAPNADMARRFTATCHPGRLAVQDGRCRPCVQMMHAGSAERVRLAEAPRPEHCHCACPMPYPEAGMLCCRMCSRVIPAWKEDRLCATS